MRRSTPLFICILVVMMTTAPALSQNTGPSGNAADGPVVSGTLRPWHTVTITFTGPDTSESATPNPFTDYRLDVTIWNGDTKVVVPGFYAADANAAHTGATVGNKWQVRFTPDRAGRWQFKASFRKGKDVAMADDPQAGTSAGHCDGAAGHFQVEALLEDAPGFRAKGRLEYVGERYLRHAQTKAHWIKGGADSPENFLGYADFDGTYRIGKLDQRRGENFADHLHRYQPHVRDWQPGDPTWGPSNDKGKGIIGALNYLASQQMNSVYFLTMNIAGDGKDVWPYTSHDERFRFDCSKLDQWEIVFEHMDRLGIQLHVVTQEQENDQLLDGGDLGRERRLYYRELIARFSHHLGVEWNLGEENTNTDAQRKAFCTYIKRLDPYDHPIKCHTFPGKYDQVYNPLLGFEHFDGPSLQTNDTHKQTLRWVTRSMGTARPWVVCLDEIGPANTGVKPDKDDPGHDEVRKKHLWGHLMAGGAGVEWYFGYKFAHNDLNCEDWRSRANMWAQTRHALTFFHEHLPFAKMFPADALIDSPDAYCLAQAGDVYAVYLPSGGTTTLNLGRMKADFDVHWYNPRVGGPLEHGSFKTITGPGKVSIGQPPRDAGKDWAVVVRRRHAQATRHTLRVPGDAGSGTYPTGRSHQK